MKPAAGLKLTLLGGFHAQLEAGSALVLPTRKAQALLAYLAIPLGQAHPREKLATLLWGDMQDAQARGNLRYALSKIRKALPRNARPGLVLDGPSVALDPAVVEVDVARLERLVADGRPGWRWPSARSRSGSRPSGSVCTSWPSRAWAICSAISSRPAPPSRPSRPASVSSRWTRCRSLSTARSCGCTRGSGAGRLRCANTSFASTH